MIKKTSDGKTGGKGPSPGENGTIFADKRSGRDRREEQAPTVETQRRVAERRKGGGRGSKSAWWLERDYVESHHFVQKSSGPRSRKGEDDITDD